MLLTDKARTATESQFRIEAGIHENVYLEPVKMEKTNNGKPFIEFNLVFNDGFSLSLTEFTPIPFNDETQEQADERAFNRLVSIMDVYPDLQSKNIDAETYAEAMVEFVKILTNYEQRKSAPLRVVLVYNKTGFLKFPNGLNKGKNKFIEVMTGKEIANTNHKFGEKPPRPEETKKVSNIDDLPF